MGTKFWGPLGWMTLHSISAIYPEQPTVQEKQVLTQFMEYFRESITCVHCKSHFTGMFRSYTSIHSEWNASRYDFFLFVCRAHNTVNRRLDKPLFPTITDCIDRLKENTKINSAELYRNAYINYLINNWSREYSADGYINADLARKMKKINDEYFTPRDKGFENLVFFENGNTLEFIPEDSGRYNVGKNLPNASSFIGKPLPKVGFRNGKLKLN